MILVTGGTGFVGRHLVSALLAEGRPVRLLLNAERAAKLPWPEPPEVVIGSILDEEALFRAATGAHVIIHLENALWWGRARDLERIELAGTRALITAARAARVGRIITLSQLGATPASAYPLLRIKGQVEEAVRNSGLAYTIVRPGLAFGADDAFFNHLAMLLRSNPFVFFLPGRGEVVLHPLYIGDLVRVLLGCLDRMETIDAIFDVGGPEYITLGDLVRTIMRVSGAPRGIVHVPPYLMRWTSRAFGLALRRNMITEQWLDITASNRTARIGAIYQTFGIRPQRFEDTLLTYMPRRGYAGALLRYSFRRRPRVL
jgi:NADH dehydrogenase